VARRPRTFFGHRNFTAASQTHLLLPVRPAFPPSAICKRGLNLFNRLRHHFRSSPTPHANLTPSPATAFVHSRREALRANGRRPRAKFLQAESKPVQAGPRKRAWIFLDSFVRFGAFQWVMSIPNEKKFPSQWPLVTLCSDRSAPSGLAPFPDEDSGFSIGCGANSTPLAVACLAANYACRCFTGSSGSLQTHAPSPGSRLGEGMTDK